jgi:hypothetical protein
MKRTSQLAMRLSRGLGRRGRPTTTRALERCSQAGLGPEDEALSFEEQLAHFGKLSELSRSGQDAKVATRRMASYGFKCKNLRGVLVDLGEPVPVPTLDLSSGPKGDASFGFIESEVQDMLAHADSLPPLAVGLLRVMLGNAARHSPKLGGEGAVSTLYSVIVSSLCHVMGGNFFNMKGMAALLNLDPDEITAQDEEALNQFRRFDVSELASVYRSAPIDDLVAAAQLLREHGREVLDHIGLSNVTDAQIEEGATLLAPAAVYVMQWVSRHFPDFPPVLPSMNEAA